MLSESGVDETSEQLGNKVATWRLTLFYTYLISKFGTFLNTLFAN